MATTLHITSGDIAGGLLAKAELAGEILVWHDILYDGPRAPGWPDNQTLQRRSAFIEEFSGSTFSAAEVLQTFQRQYDRLAASDRDGGVLLWFDGCLFDQAMLAHLLSCLADRRHDHVELICVGEFAGIIPFNGLGQLNPGQLRGLLPARTPVTEEQFSYSTVADAAFAAQEEKLLQELAGQKEAPLPFMPAAIRRWLAERPHPKTGLGRLETLILEALAAGPQSPWQIFNTVAAADSPLQYWGDITLWQKINGLADRPTPLLTIAGPAPRLPQWPEHGTVNGFTITRCTP